MKTFLNIAYYVFAGVVLLLGVLLVLLQTNFLPDYQVKIVQSGSMEPALKTGGVVVIKAQDTYAVGDIVTFADREADVPTTHRIIALELSEGAMAFTTKGDANAEADVALVPQEQIIGAVIFHVPFLGFVLDFARQPLGFVLIVVLPALLIMFEELRNMYRAVRVKKPLT